MTYRPNQAIAAEIQSQLRKAMEHDHIKVKPMGRHFLIQLELEDGMETVARITSITSRLYCIAFRTHTGRWEPVPDEGTLEKMITLVYTLFGPYLALENY